MKAAQRHLLAWTVSMAWAVSGAEARQWDIEPSLLGDPRTEPLASVLEGARAQALERLAGRYGLRPGALPISWKLRWALPRGGSPAERSAAVFEAGRTEILRRSVSVIVPARRYLQRPEKARFVVAHEACHALMASTMSGRRRYEAVPQWFREGIALLASGEGNGRVGARISFTVVSGREPRSLVVGLDGDTATPAEAYLAVRVLADRMGNEGLTALLGDLARGKRLETLLEGACGLEYERLLERFRTDAWRRVGELVPAALRRSFGAGLELLQSGDSAGAREMFTALARKSPEGPLTPTCRYFRARALIAEGALEAAREDLESLLSAPAVGIWEPEVLNSLAECGLALGRVAEARAYLRESVERFPEDSSAVRWAERIRRRIVAGN